MPVKKLSKEAAKKLLAEASNNALDNPRFSDPISYAKHMLAVRKSFVIEDYDNERERNLSGRFKNRSVDIER